jgi:exopolysaccharide biosynthesis polyprenyl glycosylphosphotransferase
VGRIGARRARVIDESGEDETHDVGPAPAARAARDVRLTPELAHRRLLLAMLRTSLRIGVLLTLDALVVASAWTIARGFVTASGPAAATPLPAAVTAVALVALAACGNYRAGSFRRSFARVAAAVLWAALALAFLTFLGSSRAAPPALIAAFAAAAAAGVAAVRVAVESVVRQAYARGIGLRRAVLVGRARDARATVRLLREGTTDQRVVGTVRSSGDAPGHALLRELADLLRRTHVEEVVIVTPLPTRTLDGVVEAAFAAGARCFAVPWALAPQRARADPVRLGACPAFRLHPAEFELPEFLVKRTLDLTLTLLALLVALPLAAVIAVAIRAETRGPVFFRQRRVGLGGREFVMWKFRSMRPAAHDDRGALAHLNPYGDAPLFKLPRDPRVTRVGRVLRRTSLDELPQLINVLRGEMSLVGPRPPLPEEVARYRPEHHARLSVLPGLTGPWQVNGRNLITDFERVVQMEREYIDTWSLRADLRILFRTVGVVLSGRGAY